RSMPVLIDAAPEPPSQAKSEPKQVAPASTVVVAPEETKPRGARPTQAVFPLARAPDDPGPNGAETGDAANNGGFPSSRPTYGV
ncbi:hypothetical protein ACIKTA_08945, partial [Hansschlegelia beijingensis]